MKLHRIVVKGMLEIYMKYKFEMLFSFFKINLQKLLFLLTDCCCVCVCVRGADCVHRQYDHPNNILEMRSLKRSFRHKTFAKSI